MHTKHRGAYNELTACLWLLKQGYEVFRNVSPHGLTDIVAIKGKEVHRIDVKKGGYQAKRWSNSADQTLEKQQVDQGVKRLNVFKNGVCELVLSPRALKDRNPRICPYCLRQFIPTIGRQIFCCKQHSRKHHKRAHGKTRPCEIQRNENATIGSSDLFGSF
jgi:Holliday junction resolvase-like predicted endonuclease